MKRTLTLLLLGLLLPLASLFAKKNPRQFSSGNAGDEAMRTALIRAFTTGRSAAASHALQKNTSLTDPVLAETFYDYSLSPGAQLQDSLRFIYSNSRTAAFDFYSLGYDLDNGNDIPPASPLGYRYVAFDTVRTYDPPGSRFYRPTSIRTYNTAGLPTLFVKDTNQRIYYLYDVLSGRLSGTITITNYGSIIDSTRHTYTYNTSSVLLRDSTFTWTAGAWKATGLSIFSNNAGGYPVQEVRYTISGSALSATMQFQNTYNSTNQLTRIIQLINLPGLGFRNVTKDTFAYGGSKNLIVLARSYNADTTAWVLSRDERRHLEATYDQPDSVWYIEDNGSGFDTTIEKLAYNNNGDPIYLRSYNGSRSYPREERRWYYSATLVPVPSSVAQPAVVQPLRIYPNPADGLLYVMGSAAGTHYSIRNTAGQLVQGGVLDATFSVPVNGLPAGAYTILVQEQSGAGRAATFIRR